jgi:GntR family transcriptional regulator
MFVTQGAKEHLFEDEKRSFLEVEWPKILVRIHRLGLRVEELTKELPQKNGESS